jgi:excisionase family DNA binding protein
MTESTTVNTVQNRAIVMLDTEAAELLNMSVHTLRKMRCQGTGPAYRKLGRSVRYAMSDLQSYIEKSAVAR